ncbi:hypothetical protein EDD95_5067 [Streptomyces sp. CEV 2-1]|nr:hypothetical protein EDD95_5067 [Streptomyces sp. CEV 2-1]
MGRHKQHKPRRPRSESGQPTTEWFGTAFHSTEGMQHLDVRQSGNGILITSSPAEIDGLPASWPLRLRNDVDGGLNEVGTALAAGRGHVFGVTEGPGYRTVLAFMPNHPDRARAGMRVVCRRSGCGTTQFSWQISMLVGAAAARSHWSAGNHWTLRTLRCRRTRPAATTSSASPCAWSTPTSPSWSWARSTTPTPR